MVLPHPFPLYIKNIQLVRECQTFEGGNMLTLPQCSAPNVFAIGNV